MREVRRADFLRLSRNNYVRAHPVEMRIRSASGWTVIFGVFKT